MVCLPFCTLTSSSDSFCVVVDVVIHIPSYFSSISAAWPSGGRNNCPSLNLLSGRFAPPAPDASPPLQMVYRKCGDSSRFPPDYLADRQS